MKIEKDHTLLKPHNGVKVFVKSHSTFTMFLTTIMIVGIFNLVNKGVSDLEMCTNYFAYPGRIYEKNTHSSSVAIRPEKPV